MRTCTLLLIALIGLTTVAAGVVKTTQRTRTTRTTTTTKPTTSKVAPTSAGATKVTTSRVVSFTTKATTKKAKTTRTATTRTTTTTATPLVPITITSIDGVTIVSQSQRPAPGRTDMIYFPAGMVSFCATLSPALSSVNFGGVGAVIPFTVTMPCSAEVVGAYKNKSTGWGLFTGKPDSTGFFINGPIGGGLCSYTLRIADNGAGDNAAAAARGVICDPVLFAALTKVFTLEVYAPNLMNMVYDITQGLINGVGTIIDNSTDFEAATFMKYDVTYTVSTITVVITSLSSAPFSGAVDFNGVCIADISSDNFADFTAVALASSSPGFPLTQSRLSLQGPNKACVNFGGLSGLGVGPSAVASFAISLAPPTPLQYGQSADQADVLAAQAFPTLGFN